MGNWVADEVLYQAKLHPAASVDALSPEQVKQTWPISSLVGLNIPIFRDLSCGNKSRARRTSPVSSSSFESTFIVKFSVARAWMTATE